MLTIVEGTEPIKVNRTTVCIFGQPGICKTSLGYTSEEPLLLDFDHGAHRAINRRRTATIETWADVDELLAKTELMSRHRTLVVDTVGRALDMMSEDIIAKDPKKGRDGALNQQGWGVLKARFKAFQQRLYSFGMDLVLLSHDREEKDGEGKVIRPDISGGSFGEVMKSSDFVAYVYMQNKDRILDFSPTDRWYGKNPAQWNPFKVPATDPDFLGNLLRQGRERLGAISAENAAVAGIVSEWKDRIGALKAVDDINAAIPEIKKLAPAIVAAQVKKILGDRAKVLGLKVDKDKGIYIAPAAA